MNILIWNCRGAMKPQFKKNGDGFSGVAQSYPHGYY